MSKQSLIDNQDAILETLPTDELKASFKASLEEPEAAQPSADELVAEANTEEHVSDDMLAGIKEDIVRDDSAAPLSGSDLEAAMAANLADVSTEPNEGEAPTE